MLTSQIIESKLQRYLLILCFHSSLFVFPIQTKRAFTIHNFHQIMITPNSANKVYTSNQKAFDHLDSKMKLEINYLISLVLKKSTLFCILQQVL